MLDQPSVTIAPTLARMAGIYARSRAGGRSSPRFAEYLAQAEHHWGLASFNPMAGDTAAATVSAAMALGAESVAGVAAHDAADRCEWRDPITLAVVVATPGMWTDRLATEIRHRTVAERRASHGEILLWTGDPLSVESIARESIAETARTMWTSLHGPAASLGAVLAREGLAYALAPVAPPSQAADAPVTEAIEVLGDTSSLGDIVAVLYGDIAATALGYTPLGLTDHAGYDWAIARAVESIAQVGAARALRL